MNVPDAPRKITFSKKRAETKPKRVAAEKDAADRQQRMDVAMNRQLARKAGGNTQKPLGQRWPDNPFITGSGPRNPDYRYMVGWNFFRGIPAWESERLITAAREEGAPHTALYKHEGKWITFDDVKREKTRESILFFMDKVP